MDTQNLVDAINKKAAEERAVVKNQEMLKRNAFVEKLNSIKKNQKRINDLCIIAQTLLNNNIKLGNSTRFSACGFPYYEFETDGIFHGFGFLVRRGVVVGIGIEGGGWDGQSFIVSPNGESNIDINTTYGFNEGRCRDYPWGVSHIARKVDSFIEKFDDFETKFLSFAESYIN